MQNPVLLIVAAVFAAGLCLVLAMMTQLRARRSATSVLPDTDEAETPAAARGLIAAIAAAVKPTNPLEAKALHERIIQAGLYGHEALNLYLTVRISVLVGAAGVAGLSLYMLDNTLLALLLMLLGTTVAIIAPPRYLVLRAQMRQKEVNLALPSALDILIISLDAGLSLQQALSRLAGHGMSGHTLNDELAITLGEIKAGVPMPAAFRKLAARIPSEDLNALASAIGGASTMGASLADVLRGYAATIRQTRLMKLEESAGKANARLSLPLAMCLLPAVLLIVIGPAALMVMSGW